MYFIGYFQSSTFNAFFENTFFEPHDSSYIQAIISHEEVLLVKKASETKLSQFVLTQSLPLQFFFPAKNSIMRPNVVNTAHS